MTDTGATRARKRLLMRDFIVRTVLGMVKTEKMSKECRRAIINVFLKKSCRWLVIREKDKCVLWRVARLIKGHRLRGVTTRTWKALQKCLGVLSPNYPYYYARRD